MIELGIVGLGPVWDKRYWPVLEKLRHRVRIGAVFDPVASRCDQVAQELNAVPYQGMLALLSRAEVRGVLVLDTSWHGNVLLRFLRKAKKPVYIAGSLGEDWDEISRLRIDVESEGLLVMPEFSRRFTPATCRLHELIATCLGRPRHISIDAITPAADGTNSLPGQTAGTDFLIGLLDWCRYVVRTATLRLESHSLAPHAPSDDGQRHIAIEFAEMLDRGRRPTAELRLRNPGQQPGQRPEHGEGSPPLSFTVHCENGEAVIEGPDHIRWTVAGRETTTESLTADRSEVEVMIDHFCRRLVGGLIPIADVADVCRCLRLVQAAAVSYSTRTPVQLNGDIG